LFNVGEKSRQSDNSLSGLLFKLPPLTTNPPLPACAVSRYEPAHGPFCGTSVTLSTSESSKSERQTSNIVRSKMSHAAPRHVILTSYRNEKMARWPGVAREFCDFWAQVHNNQAHARARLPLK